MNTQDSTNPSPTASQVRVLPTENDQVVDSTAAKDEPRTLRELETKTATCTGIILPKASSCNE